MADFVFNVAKGRVHELARNVDAGSPANSRLVVVAIKASGIEADDTLNNYDDLAALLTATNDEATNSGYTRKELAGADVTVTVDDTNNRVDIDISDQTWTGVQTTGGAWAKLLVCYDADNAAGTDSNIIPLTAHDFAVTPDGSDIVAQINASGFYRAS